MLAGAGPAACVPRLVKTVGLVDVGDSVPTLVDTEGERLRMRVDPGTHEVQLAAMGGCTVQVEGTAVGRVLQVDRYAVLDAGDGAAPFVGPLRAEQGMLVLYDRQGAGRLRLLNPEQGDLSELAALVDQDILLIGFVAAAQGVVPVRWRGLGPVLPPTVAPTEPRQRAHR